MDVRQPPARQSKVRAVNRWKKIVACFDHFLFEGCDPRVCSLIRILYGGLLVIYTMIWMIDANLWFTGSGVMTAATAYAAGLGPRPSLFFWLPSTPAVIHVALVILFVQACLLMLGCWSRIQVVCIFIWLVSFQHRNHEICDGEDTVFRLFSFLMIWMPLDHRWSLLRAWFRGPPSQATAEHAWALRLVQFEMSAIYLSTAYWKLTGSQWRDGTALYYVAQMQDVFGRGWFPTGLFELVWFVKLSTWGVLIGEIVLPFALWLRPTRRWAIALGMGLHLAIEYSMNLLLFEWIMMVGLLSFVRLPSGQPTPSDLPAEPTHVDTNL